MLTDHRTSLLGRLEFRSIDLFRRIVTSFCTWQVCTQTLVFSLT